MAAAKAAAAEEEAAKAAAAKTPAPRGRRAPKAPERAYIVRVAISGFRNGVPWPPIGEAITLPVDEGDHYARLGYVALPE